MKTALLVVERDFDTAHVGVARVIDFYANLLATSGYEVTFATPMRQGLAARKYSSSYVRSDDVHPQHPEPKSLWRGGKVTHKALTVKTSSIKWSNRIVVSADYDVSIVTNPWLVEEFNEVVRNQQFTFGIVYDVIPNLVSLGVLNFGFWIDVSLFARAHSLGLEFFNSNCKKILAISQSTKADVLSLFQQIKPESVEVLVPFAHRSEVVQSASVVKGLIKLLVVNGLDHRKNFAKAAKAMQFAAKKIDVEVTFVGRERISARELNETFECLRKSGVRVNWYREVSDKQLSDLYLSTDYLLFPSIYEGLGLPILEAQAHGVAVISSNNSSCVEINLNPRLAIDPYNWSGMSDLFLSLALNPPLILRGEKLRRRQDAQVNQWSKKFAVYFGASVKL